MGFETDDTEWRIYDSDYLKAVPMGFETTFQYLALLFC